jgi:glycosyltransferase involved in cell wall biosynthesis
MSAQSSNRLKLVAVETHPIQYKAPLFRLLQKDPRFDLTVLYAMIPDASQQAGTFGVPFQWDVPLLEGYRYELLENRSKSPSMSRFSGCDTPGIHRRLKELNPDVVLVNGWVVKTCIQALVACRRLKIPCMVRGESNLLSRRAWWKHVLHEVLLPQYSAYLSIGSACRAFYRFHHRPEAQIFHTPYSVDNDFFSAHARELLPKRCALREAFGAPRDSLVFSFVGKLERKKRPLGLLRALSALTREQQEAVHLLVAGDGPLMEECLAFVEHHRLPVTFTGFLNQSRVPEVYAAADVLVLPSDSGETWGLVVNEAMASGRPAIVSRSVGGCEDLVVEGETGFSFELDDEAALTDLLGRYIEEPTLASAQGARAAEHIQGFSFSEILEGLARAVAHCSGREVEC